MACIQGTCMDMCPKAERSFRQKNNLVHSLEKCRKFVKQFSRSAAGRKDQLPTDLRPSGVLAETMKYLMAEILPKKGILLSVKYEFINDRIQSIRQDLFIQNVKDQNAIFIIERAVKFYIVFQVLMQQESVTAFDPVLNQQQLYVCLQRLLQLYNTVENSKNQTEFISIYAAHNLGNEATLINILKTESKDKYPLNAILALNQALLFRNFVRFFKILKELPLILQLSCFECLYKFRSLALKVICSGYSSKNCKLPLDALCSWLNLNDKDVRKLCKNYSLTISDNCLVNFKKSFPHNSVSDKVVFCSELSTYQQKIHETITKLCDNVLEQE